MGFTMPEIALVTDSSSCLPDSVQRQYGIISVPLVLQIGDETYADGSLTTAELFRRAREIDATPRTASPSPADFAAAFRRAADGGATSVVCLTLSSAYSGTYDSALAARSLVAEDMPGAQITVVDTGGLAMTHGFAVLAAARAIESGADAGAAARAAVAVASRSRLAGVLGTTEYLARGGRVPWIVHWAAKILNIHPMLAFEKGRARSIGRVRTIERGLARLAEYARKRATPDGLRVAVMHAEAPEAASRLAEIACRELNPQELIHTGFTSVMAVHTGPGFVGLAFYNDDED